jgi:broad specificity phosphatase PhoE
MNLYFVRHGESEANILHEISNRGEKHPLTDRGIQQAETLAESLRGLPLTRIFTSPLLRARQTAQILGDSLNIPVETTDALREYDCGLLEGRADPAAWALFWQVNNAWLAGNLEMRLSGGESFNDMQARFVPFVEDVITTTGDKLFVSHGGLYRLMLPLLLTNIDHEWAHEHPIGNTAYILAETGPDGLVCLEWCGETPPKLERQ